MDKKILVNLCSNILFMWTYALLIREYHYNWGQPEERGGSLVECLTQDPVVVDLSFTGGTALCLSKTFYHLLSTGSSMEDPCLHE